MWPGKTSFPHPNERYSIDAFYIELIDAQVIKVGHYSESDVLAFDRHQEAGDLFMGCGWEGDDDLRHLMAIYKSRGLFRRSEVGNPSYFLPGNVIDKPNYVVTKLRLSNDILDYRTTQAAAPD